MQADVSTLADNQLAVSCHEVEKDLERDVIAGKTRGSPHEKGVMSSEMTEVRIVVSYYKP